MIGIIGALLLRAVAILAGVALISAFEPIVYVFGLLLVYVAYRALRGAPETANPETNTALRVVRRFLPTTNDFRGARLFVRSFGRRH
jgi:tellurite resistance protein TerC